jgi:hypothetical protein
MRWETGTWRKAGEVVRQLWMDLLKSLGFIQWAKGDHWGTMG